VINLDALFAQYYERLNLMTSVLSRIDRILQKAMAG
jgi:hypothetical protein